MKYRIYDTVEKIYLEEPDFRWSISRGGLLYNSENDEWHEVGERYIVEVFSGLLDYYGATIFEGDIIQLSDIMALITYKDGSFHMEMPGNTQGKSHAVQDRTKAFEVVGNIHDNTDLLK